MKTTERIDQEEKVSSLNYTRLVFVWTIASPQTGSLLARYDAALSDVSSNKQQVTP